VALRGGTPDPLVRPRRSLRHAAAGEEQDAQAVLRVGVALARRLEVPLRGQPAGVGVGGTCNQAVGVHVAQLELRFGQALACGAFEPVQCLGVALAHAVAVVVQHAQLQLRLRAAGLRQRFEQAHGGLVVLALHRRHRVLQHVGAGRENDSDRAAANRVCFMVIAWSPPGRGTTHAIRVPARGTAA
jgi:hypothetical protein